jgi:hypothetical protein
MLDLKRTLSAFVIANSLLAAIAAQAATYYVAKTGSDAITCVQAQNIATPKLTLAAGVACLASGDTLMVRGGTYSAQGIPANTAPSGTPGAYTIIRGYGTERPKLLSNATDSSPFAIHLYDVDKSYIEVRQFEFDGMFTCARMEGATPGGLHHIRMIDVICHDTFSHGMLVDARTSDHYFAENTFYRMGVGRPDYTVGINTFYGTGSRTIIEKNIIHDVSWGINVYTALSPQPEQSDVIIRGNVIYNVGRDDLPGNGWMTQHKKGPGIFSTATGTNRQIYNNIVYNSKGFAGIGVDRDNFNAKVYNNTVNNQVNDAPGIAVFGNGSGSGHEVKNNIAYLTGGIFIASGRGTESNNLTTNPSFVDAAKANFRLRAESAAIDAGVKVSQVTTDFSGVRRPQGAGYDIGAYEAGNGSDLVPPLAPAGLAVQ